MVGAKLRASVGIALRQLRHYPVRTLLVVFAIALAVLSATLLASVGIGVLETGEQRFAAANQDLWVTGGPIRFAPGTVGGFENTILDAHRDSTAMAAHEDVAIAAPMAFQTVYVGTDPTNLETVIGVGVPNIGAERLQLQAGSGFTQGDVHYADGNYTGPMTHEVIIDRRTASLFDVSVGETLYIGGTIANARQHEFTVVGVSTTFTRLLGAPSVVVHLSELQELTGTTRTDRASIIVITLEAGADAEAVKADLERQFPAYEVRTNEEQLAAVLRNRGLVIASAVALVVLAVVAGVVLTATVLTQLVYHQRTELAALKAAGVSAGTLVGVTAWQAVVLSVIGGAVGVAATPPLAAGLNALARRTVGIGSLVRTPDWVLLMGVGIAFGIGVGGAVAAGWLVVRISPLEQLRE